MSKREPKYHREARARMLPLLRAMQQALIAVETGNRDTALDTWGRLRRVAGEMSDAPTPDFVYKVVHGERWSSEGNE